MQGCWHPYMQKHPLATRGLTKKKAKAVQLSSYQAPEAVRQLKTLAAEQGSTIQALTAEALNLVFAKYGKPTIATP
jgi:hypothetical protein